MQEDSTVSTVVSEDEEQERAPAYGTGGIDYYEQELAPELAAVAKLAQRIGQGKALAKQAVEANRGDTLRQLDDLARLGAELVEQAGALREAVDQFRMVNADEDREAWTRRFTEACRANGHEVEGEYPAFRIFPLEMRVDFTNGAILLNGRTVRALHPKAVAALVDREIGRLNKARFNAPLFMKALARAYDLLLAERPPAPGAKGVGVVTLKEIHALLALRSGTSVTSGYTLNQFAFDVYRLRTQSEHRLVLDGRRLVFGQTRNPKDVIAIPKPGGTKESFGALELVLLDEGDGGDEE